MFARLLDTAAEGYFRLLLGPGYQQIIARAFVQPNHDLSYQTTSFAEMDRRVVGMISAHSGLQHQRADKRALKKAAGRWNLRMLIVSTLFSPMIRRLETVDEQDYYLLAIAVDDALRGQGIGSFLLNAAEKMAYDSGSTRLVLDVTHGNAGARSLYQRRGFAIVSRWPRVFPVPALTFYRMSKPVASPGLNSQQDKP